MLLFSTFIKIPILHPSHVHDIEFIYTCYSTREGGGGESREEEGGCPPSILWGGPNDTSPLLHPLHLHIDVPHNK